MHIILCITKRFDTEDYIMLDKIMREEFDCHRNCCFLGIDGTELN
jgi:hypothetical protein